MPTIQQEAIRIISALPQTATLDDIMYRLYVLDKIKKSQAAADRGETITVDDLKKEMEAGYQQMALDEDREQEALEWAEATCGDGIQEK